MSALGKCVWSHALFGLTFVSALASGGIAAAQPCQTDARSPEPPPTKAISLRRYEAALERCQAAKSCDTATLTLYGLTRVSGFVIDAQHHDVIIYGSDRPAAAPLYATDFAVALRNAERLYVKRDGGRLYYADPGVSIDPDPSVIHRLQALMAGSETSFAERDRRLEAWCSTCALPQRVRAEGVPVSHFLAVLFRADYLLKSVSNGKVPVTGMDSLSELAMRRAIASATAQPPEDAEIASLDRFWFHPGRTEYVESADSTELDRADVVLLTEAEMLRTDGRIGARQGSDSLAQSFACDFSRRLPELEGAASPYGNIFGALEGEFRWVAIAHLLVDGPALQKAGYRPAFLEHGMEIPLADVPVMVPGVAAVRRWDQTETHGRIRTSLSLRLPSCGGVEISIDRRTMSLVAATRGRLPAERQAVLRARPDSAAIWWAVRV